MPSRGEKAQNLVLVIVATCALVATTLTAFRTFRPAKVVDPPAAIEVADWERYMADGHRIGPANTPVTIVEFSDFQCPFCKKASTTLANIRKARPTEVSVVYRHFPLERIHPLAREAAIASECADRQGRFEKYHDALFAIDSLSGNDWLELARRSGVTDTVAFVSCLHDPATAIRVDRDVAAGAELHITATPTVLVNQYLVNGGARRVVLDSLIQLVLANKHRE